MNRRSTLKSICCAVGALFGYKAKGDVLGLDDYESAPFKYHGTYWCHYDGETGMFTSGVITNGKKILLSCMIAEPVMGAAFWVTKGKK